MRLMNNTTLIRCPTRQQAPVVRRVDSPIHWIIQLVLLFFIRWIVIYPVDSTIHRLNNWGQIYKSHEYYIFPCPTFLAPIY